MKVMTDGVLLAETQRDRWLEKYDTIIVDEAHERSLNIDFLLGYLKRLCRGGPTSSSSSPRPPSTPNASPALRRRTDPIMRSRAERYPVEVRYRAARAPTSPTLRELVKATVDAVNNAAARGRATCWSSCPASARSARPPSLEKGNRSWHVRVLPLYARLSAEEQSGSSGQVPAGAIVLATNVAETSLTVPGIRYVIDSGVARISRYSPRARLQKLGIEPISQASANWPAPNRAVCVRR